MGIVEKTERKPNYYKDIKTFGKCAEDDFISHFYDNPSNNNKTLFDVRNIKQYQNVDIDFIIDKNGDNEINETFENVLINNRYVKVEVKYNSVALETGYLAYESISHGSLGWGDVTKCDLIYQVFTERDSLKIVKRAWIYMNKWKNYLADRNNKKKLSIIKNEDIVDLLCDLYDMENKGVLKFI